MFITIRYQRAICVTCVFALLVIFFTRCMSNGDAAEKKDEIATAAGFADYAGDEKCAGCHKAIYEQHQHTAHHLTSLAAAENNVWGSFKKDSNIFAYTPTLNIKMEKRDSGLYQVVYFNNEEKMAMRFNITVGSGTMGQSYIEKRGNRFYQMPVTYFSAAKQWSNSPGFPEDKVLTDRPVTARCLECHATFAQGVGGTEMEPAGFDSDKMLLGVGCEKCHGPAAKHVAYYTEHPSEKGSKFIVRNTALSRQQQLDVCALCHGGKIQKTQPSFTFTAGKNLMDYFAGKTIVDKAMSSGEVEVHGNQYGLLTASKCFKQSTTLTCNSCHSAHQNERGNMELYSTRCMSCHDINAQNFKTATHTKFTDIAKDCITCHMPQQASRAIAVKLQGQDETVASMIRSHYIGIYPEQTTKYSTSKNK